MGTSGPGGCRRRVGPFIGEMEIDTVEKKVYVDRTKDQTKAAPEFDELDDDAQYPGAGWRLLRRDVQRSRHPDVTREAGRQASDACWAASRWERDPRRSSPGVPLLAEPTETPSLPAGAEAIRARQPLTNGRVWLRSGSTDG
jgi:hypothetical protein